MALHGDQAEQLVRERQNLRKAITEGLTSSEETVRYKARLLEILEPAQTEILLEYLPLEDPQKIATIAAVYPAVCAIMVGDLIGQLPKGPTLETKKLRDEALMNMVPAMCISFQQMLLSSMQEHSKDEK